MNHNVVYEKLFEYQVSTATIAVETGLKSHLPDRPAASSQSLVNFLPPMSSDSSSEDDDDGKSSSVSSSGDATPNDATPSPRAAVDCRLPGLILVPSPVQLRNQQTNPPVARVTNNSTASVVAASSNNNGTAVTNNRAGSDTASTGN